MGRLDNKVAIITGSGAGIGKAIATRFAEEGAKVVIADFNEEALNQTVTELTDAGHQALGIHVNVAIEEDINHIIDHTIETYGKIDILINNAGVGDQMQATHHVEDDTWNRVMDINVTSIMRASRKIIPHFMENGGGNIINMASITGVTGGRGGLAYTTAKHAVVGMTKNIASHYASENIRCNAIAPAHIDTGFAATMDNVDQFGMKAATRGVNLMPRAGTVDEMANITLFLASDDSTYINGVVLPVDGGWSAY